MPDMSQPAQVTFVPKTHLVNDHKRRAFISDLITKAKGEEKTYPETFKYTLGSGAESYLFVFMYEKWSRGGEFYEIYLYDKHGTHLGTFRMKCGVPNSLQMTGLEEEWFNDIDVMVKKKYGPRAVQAPWIQIDSIELFEQQRREWEEKKREERLYKQHEENNPGAKIY